MKEERKIKMTITKEQETTVEMTLMDYLLDMEDFIQGKHAFDLYLSGYSDKDVASMTGINERTFRRYREKYNIVR